MKRFELSASPRRTPAHRSPRTARAGRRAAFAPLLRILGAICRNWLKPVDTHSSFGLPSNAFAKAPPRSSCMDKRKSQKPFGTVSPERCERRHNGELVAADPFFQSCELTAY